MKLRKSCSAENQSKASCTEAGYHRAGTVDIGRATCKGGNSCSSTTTSDAGLHYTERIIPTLILISITCFALHRLAVLRQTF